MEVAAKETTWTFTMLAQSFSFHRELQLITSNLLEMGEIKKRKQIYIDCRRNSGISGKEKKCNKRR
jgi:hypothetical protein